MRGWELQRSSVSINFNTIGIYDRKEFWSEVSFNISKLFEKQSNLFSLRILKSNKLNSY